MKTIEDAVIELGGKWPVDHNYLFYRNGSYFCAPYNESSTYQDKAICSKYEFESCAKRLGYINGYRWGVEYPTDEQMPRNLDNVEVEQYCDGEWYGKSKLASKWRSWGEVTAFRITDPRHKPADTSYLNAASVVRGDPSIRDELNLSKSLTHSEEGLTHGWHERGELPPVGVECEVYIQQRDFWAKVKVLAVDGDYIVWRNGSDNKSYIGTHRDSIRPIRTDREKVIEAAVKIYDDKKCFSAESFASELHKAGMVVLPPKKSDTED